MPTEESGSQIVLKYARPTPLLSYFVWLKLYTSNDVCKHDFQRVIGERGGKVGQGAGGGDGGNIKFLVIWTLVNL